MVEGYWITIGAKPLPVVDETFHSIPTDGTICKYFDRLSSGASVTQCKIEKKKRVRSWCAGRLSDA